MSLGCISRTFNELVNHEHNLRQLSYLSDLVAGAERGEQTMGQVRQQCACSLDSRGAGRYT
jgi:hypothetical protein